MAEFLSFFNALRKFFKPRDERDYWHLESIAKNTPWRVPSNKVYEVYAFLQDNDTLFLLAPKDNATTRRIAVGITVSAWFPAVSVVAGAWAFDKVDPVTGVVTYGVGAPQFQSMLLGFSALPQGWILTGEEGLKTSVIGQTWVVRYRDVTP